MDIESESKTSSQGKQKMDDDESTEDRSDEESKTVEALWWDMMCIIKELKGDKESSKENKE